MKGAKYKLITAAMAAVSLTVAFGGWFLTKELLDRKNAEFLNGTGAVALRSEQTALLTQEQADEAARAFKKHEIPEKQMRNSSAVGLRGKGDAPRSEGGADEYGAGDRDGKAVDCHAGEP